MRTKIDIENDILFAEKEIESLSRMTDEQIEVAYEGMNRSEVETWLRVDVLPILQSELDEYEAENADLYDPVIEIFGSYKAMYCM